MELNSALTGETKNDGIITKTKHLCWIYQEQSELPLIIDPFLTVNLSAQKRCLLAVPESTWDAAVVAMEMAGVKIDAYVDRHQVLTQTPEEFFLTGGEFDIDFIVNRLERALADALAQGWRGLSVITDASPLLGRAQEADWAAYEFRINYICASRPCMMLCLYDAAGLSGTLMTTIIKSHPVVGMGENLALNPFYQNIPTTQLT
jgi:hypothetical protein